VLSGGCVGVETTPEADTGWDERDTDGEWVTDRPVESEWLSVRYGGRDDLLGGSDPSRSGR